MSPARTIIVFAALVLLTGCASQPLITPGSRGFFWGLFDGAVAPITFIISFFNNGVRIYGYPNSGLWYDLGFLIGLTFWAGGGYARSRRNRDRDYP
jgi:hypothetical protein